MRTFAIAALIGAAAAADSCNKGHYLAYELSGLKSCFSCPVGKYQDQTGQTICTDCPSGTYGPSSERTSLSDCLSCPGSKYQANKGSSYCDAAEVECGAGSFIAQSDTGEVCTPCAPGTFNRYPNSRKCYDCPSNHWNNHEGATECNLCAAGKFNDRSGSTYCMFRAAVVIGPPRPVEPHLSCIPGKWRHGSVDACFNCPAGTFSDTAEATSCTKCDTGKYNPWSGKTASTDCLSCPAGKTSASVGSTTCSGALATSACPAGFYNVEKIDLKPGGINGAVSRQDDCAPCPDGTYSDANSKSCKRCGPGYETQGVDTHADVYTNPTAEFHNVVKQRTAGPGSCTPCKRGSYWHEGACKLCAPGTYNNIEGAFACTACAKNHFAHGFGATSCTQVQDESDRCTGGRTFMSCASPCTKSCDNQSPECGDFQKCVPRCQCPESKPFWDDRAQVCKDKTTCDGHTCEVEDCTAKIAAATAKGCHYVPHSGLDKNGCKTYQCGLLRCTSTCESPEHNLVKHGWTGPGSGGNWCNTCTCDMGNMSCTKKACGPAPTCSHLKCKFKDGHVKVTYNKRESVGMHHHCGHLDPADPRNCMCTCFS
jgi:hypothetical protein